VIGALHHDDTADDCEMPDFEVNVGCAAEVCLDRLADLVATWDRPVGTDVPDDVLREVAHDPQSRLMTRSAFSHPIRPQVGTHAEALSDRGCMVAKSTTRKDFAMCWMCDHPGRTQEDLLAEVRATMLKHGWAVQYVENDRVPYPDTIGLTRRGLPELLVTGLPPRRAARLLNGVAETSVRGDPPMDGERIAVPVGPLVEVVEVEHPDAYTDFAIAICGNSVRALQLVWADGRGRWPWAPGFDDARGRQPVLGVRAAPA
jgi:Domain of unknown function (DUF4262)